MEASEPVRRTSEIEELTNLHVIHPLSSFLVPIFARLGISPNAVSLTGMLFGVLAGFAYSRYRDPGWAVAGFVLMIAWHVMDGADGQLARLTGKQSETGKILDGICDYVTFTAVYVALAMALMRDIGAWSWMLVVLAGLCHAFQSAAYELQRQEYNFWGWNRQSATLSLPNPRATSGRARRAVDGFHRLYVRAQFRLSGLAFAFRARMATILRTASPERAAFVRRRYRETFAPVIRRWAILSANYRTIGIFIAALVRRPYYYFAFEIIGFSAILWLLILDQHARYRLFFDGLALDQISDRRDK